MNVIDSINEAKYLARDARDGSCSVYFLERNQSFLELQEILTIVPVRCWGRMGLYFQGETFNRIFNTLIPFPFLEDFSLSIEDYREKSKTKVEIMKLSKWFIKTTSFNKIKSLILQNVDWKINSLRCFMSGVQQSHSLKELDILNAIFPKGGFHYIKEAIAQKSSRINILSLSWREIQVRRTDSLKTELFIISNVIENSKVRDQFKIQMNSDETMRSHRFIKTSAARCPPVIEDRKKFALIVRLADWFEYVRGTHEFPTLNSEFSILSL